MIVIYFSNSPLKVHLKIVREIIHSIASRNNRIIFFLQKHDSWQDDDEGGIPFYDIMPCKTPLQTHQEEVSKHA